MGRLIDADKENGKLLDFITQNDTAIGYAIERKDMSILEGIIFEYIKEQETAYDVEKVTAELELVFEVIVAEILDKTDSNYTIADFNIKPYAERLCSVVREGGVSNGA